MASLVLGQEVGGNQSFSLPNTGVMQQAESRFDYLELAVESGVAARVPKIEFGAAKPSSRSGLGGIVRSSLPGYVGTLPPGGFAFTPDFDRLVSLMADNTALLAIKPGEKLFGVIDSSPLARIDSELLSGQISVLDHEAANGLNLEVDDSVRSLLNDTSKFEMLSKFLVFLGVDAERTNIRAELVTLIGSSDPEDDTTQIRVTLYFKGKDKPTLRQYYDDLCKRVDSWLRVQSDKFRHFFNANISLFVRAAANA